MSLPDLEGLAIFARVAELRSFSRAASELSLSKATISKAVTRLEKKLGTRLFNRTSRRLALTDAGAHLAARAAVLLSEAEAAESEAMSLAAAPRGKVRLAAPMSFGVLFVAPLLPELFRLHPELTIDLHLSDAQIDLIGEGFDAALRIGQLSDTSLLARRLCDMPLHLVAAPAYLKAHGRPKHPLELSRHQAISYAYQLTQDTWRFHKASGETAAVRPAGPLRVNNGEAMLPSLIAGIGIGVLPDFIVKDALADGRLERLLPGWSLPAGAVYWVTPPGGLKPKRVEILAEFLAAKLARRAPDRG
jgi:DNA-binding transcriptional LysR family regulator